MHGEPWEQMHREAGNWVKRGRIRLLRHLLRAHAPAGPLRVLDLGAGFGGNVPLLASFGTVDAAETHVAGAEVLGAMPEVRTLYTEPVPFETDATWDAVVAIEVLEHFADDRAAVAWIADHLAPGGVFVATVPAHPWMFTDHDRVVGHHRRYRRRELAALLPPELEEVALGWFIASAMPAQAAVQRLWHLARRVRGDARHVKPPTPSSGPVDRVLGRVLDAEVAWIERGRRLPLGSSLYLVARRR